MSEPLLENSEPRVGVAPRWVSMTQFFNLRKPLGRFVCFVVVLTLVFSSELIALTRHALHSNLHSYIVLVPFVVGYLIHAQRDTLPHTYHRSPYLAVTSCLIGLLAFLTAWLAPSLSVNDHLTVMTLAFVCFLAAGGFFFLGRTWMTAAAFPFGFLAFLVPMPDAMADTLETLSKLASANAASLLFDATGTPVLRDGTIFQLPNITIQVGQECSGIRSSWVLLITSLLAANLFLKSTWRRALLVSFVIPLGILRNGLRIWTIGTLCIQIGPQMINSIIHRRGGPFFFLLSLIPLFLLLWWLTKGEQRLRHRKGQSAPDP
jgi:exosortase C (VPDSG-CTERM-specific)